MIEKMTKILAGPQNQSTISTKSNTARGPLLLQGSLQIYPHLSKDNTQGPRTLNANIRLANERSINMQNEKMLNRL